MKIKVLILLAIFGTVNAIAQTNINDYKYVTVPHYFEFVKGKNAHRLNTTTRFLFKKNGFNAFMEDEIKEDDYKDNNCLALKAEVVKVNAILKTKLKVVLKNCNDEVVFESKTGESKLKTYGEAYKEALTKAFESFSDLNYQYKPNNNVVKEKKEEVKAVVTEVLEKKEDEKEEVAGQQATKKIIQTEVVEKKEIPVAPIKEQPSTLHAQATDSGFKVVDNASNIVMILLKTARPDFFIVKDQNAIVYKEEGNWYISKTVGNESTKEKLEIKF